MRTTENLHEAAPGLDTLPVHEIATHLHAAQQAAISTVSSVIPDLTQSAELMAETIRGGGRLVYAAAGSSGLMAMADALELPGTFGLPPSKIGILMPGGMPSTSGMPGHVEDDVTGAASDIRNIEAGDTVIILSASGSTPYAVEIARLARAKQARIIAIANNAEAPLFDHADRAICLATPPELVAGSTRMGAGPAQKTALNIMSTLMGVLLGHVHDGMMVNLVADNEKLRKRAACIISNIAHVPESAAREHLKSAGGAVKPAVLLAAGATSMAEADQLLANASGHLRPAMAELEVSLSQTRANQT